MDGEGLDRRRGRGGLKLLLVSSIFSHAAPTSLMDSCQSWGGEETAEIYCRLNSASLQQLAQRGFDLSLEDPGCSESLGFYNKMHHYAGIIPSSEYGQQMSYCLGDAVSISALPLYSNVVPQLYVGCICVLIISCVICYWFLKVVDKPISLQRPFSSCSCVQFYHTIFLSRRSFIM